LLKIIQHQTAPVRCKASLIIYLKSFSPLSWGIALTCNQEFVKTKSLKIVTLFPPMSDRSPEAIGATTRNIAPKYTVIYQDEK